MPRTIPGTLPNQKNKKSRCSCVNTKGDRHFNREGSFFHYVEFKIFRVTNADLRQSRERRTPKGTPALPAVALSLKPGERVGLSGWQPRRVRERKGHLE